MANTIPLIEKVEVRETLSFFDIGFGVEGFLDAREHWTGALSFTYTTIDVSQSISEIDFQESTLLPKSLSAGAIGLKFTAKYHLKSNSLY